MLYPVNPAMETETQNHDFNRTHSFGENINYTTVKEPLSWK